MFINLGFASADNYMWSETFLILLAKIYTLFHHTPDRKYHFPSWLENAKVVFSRPEYDEKYVKNERFNL